MSASVKTGSPAPARATLVLGLSALAVAAASIAWLSAFPGEAVFGPMVVAGAVLAVISVAGLVVGIVAMARRSRPKWMIVVGFATTVVVLLFAAYCLLGVLLVWMTFSTMLYY